LTTLASYTTEGVVYATHSVGLARSLSERVYSFQLQERRSVVSLFEQTPNYPEFIGEMSFSSYRELGFENLLLVEGVHEVRTVQQLMRKLGTDHKTVIIPLGGRQLIRGGLDHEFQELKRLSDKIAVLVDSERSSADTDAIPEVKAFAQMCHALEFSVHITGLRAVENYFSAAAVKAAKGPEYEALSPYQLLRAAQRPWGKEDNWRIAMYMTREELLNTDIGQFLANLS
jgi:hypothetical protein